MLRFFFLTKLGKLKFIFNKKVLNLKMWTLEFEILIKYDTFSCNSPPPPPLIITSFASPLTIGSFAFLCSRVF